MRPLVLHDKCINFHIGLRNREFLALGRGECTAPEPECLRPSVSKDTVDSSATAVAATAGTALRLAVPASRQPSFSVPSALLCCRSMAPSLPLSRPLVSPQLRLCYCPDCWWLTPPLLLLRLVLLRDSASSVASPLLISVPVATAIFLL